LVEGYLFHDDDAAPVKRTVDQHLALGISLGGHSVWQLMFAEPRVEAGVVVVGCPDFMCAFFSLPSPSADKKTGQYLTVTTDLLADRARLSKLPTYSAQDNGASFFGSKDFPPSLVDACRKNDPKAIFFGTSAVPTTTAAGPADDAARQILHDRLRGKRFLLCSGGDDKLVPYRCSEPFLEWLKKATESWFKDEDVSVDNRVYSGIGHSFSTDMIKDSVQFVLDVVAHAGERVSPAKTDEQWASKI
jgi:hypothetical protein